MIRILGAITGSALALATLLVVIGIPQFKTESSASEHAIVTLPLPTSPVEPGEPRITRSVNEPPAETMDAEDQGTPVDAAPLALASAGPSDAELAGQDEPGATAEPQIEAFEPPPVELQAVLDTPQSWYAFWSPFRSELAANGFVAQLQSVTGLDYRVVRVKPGVYEVAFAYENDDEITANLTQITAATGLELPQ